MTEEEYKEKIKNLQKFKDSQAKTIEDLRKKQTVYELLINLQAKIKGKYIFHMLGSFPQNFEYRRFKLNKFLNKNISTPIVPFFKGFSFGQDIKNAKYILVSHPGGWNNIKEELPKDCKIFYDKTDYWMLSAEEDSEIIERAEKITCSSKFIYDRLPKEKTLLIENGCDITKYDKPKEKYERLSAIYVGFPLNKLDVLKIRELAMENPNVDFYIYCQRYDKDLKIDIEDYNIPELGNIYFHEPIEYNSLIEEIKKCHVGLLTYKDTSDWFRGMYSLKVWDYIKCGIPCYYSNSINYEKLDDKYCFNADKYTLKEVLEKKFDFDEMYKLCKENAWEIKFKKILDFLELDKI